MLGKLGPAISRSCQKQPAPQVELTCLQGLADLERIEGPWLNALAARDPEGAVMLRLLMAHMASTSKRVMLEMVLNRLDPEDSSTIEHMNHSGLQSAAEG